ncbi:MAG TPA: response regulator transcription factor [Flavisolibacter sp.]|nr:response regulator transcription factor [Flavisolibacter sp.]
MLTTTRKTGHPIRVAIADDHVLLMEFMKDWIEKNPELEFTGTAYNGKELVTLVEQTLPNVVLCDVKMPLMDGIEATRKIKDKFPHVQVLAFSAFDEECNITDMIAAGANGYILKSAHSKELLLAIKTVYNKEHYYGSSITNKIVKMASLQDEPKKAALTARDKKLMELTCKELSSKEIAKELNITCRAIESSRARLFEKLNIRNIAGLVAYAIKNKISIY